MLPEIRETDAPPHIAALYADIKDSTALLQVNLIFRYLATHEGVLEWVWQTLRPLYRSQELADAAVALTREIDRPGPSPLVAALAQDDLRTVKQVVDSYNSGNPQNIIGLTTLIRLRDGKSKSGASAILSPRSFGAQDDAASFPTIPKRDDLAPDTFATVEQLAARHPRAPGVVPSLYLHLALWPAALDAANAHLDPMVGSPSWAALVKSVIGRAGDIADQLAPAIELAPNPPNAAALDEALGTVETFINKTIPEMVVVGRMLEIE